MRHVRVSRARGRLILRIEERKMGKSYDAYQQAVQAEQMAKETMALHNTEETFENARQAEIIANALFSEMLDDPEK